MTKIKTFPLIVPAEWLDRLGKAVPLSSETSKHDFIIKAVEEKMERLEKRTIK